MEALVNGGKNQKSHAFSQAKATLERFDFPLHSSEAVEDFIQWTKDSENKNHGVSHLHHPQYVFVMEVSEAT
jgi:hypothetical protein